MLFSLGVLDIQNSQIMFFLPYLLIEKNFTFFEIPDNARTCVIMSKFFSILIHNCVIEKTGGKETPDTLSSLKNLDLQIH